MSLTSRKQPLDMRAILVQGDSVRMTWGFDEQKDEERKPLRREKPTHAVVEATEDPLRVRLGEELDYVRRLLGTLGNELSGDPILLRRHGVALQSLDIVGQILGHIGTVIRSIEPCSAVEEIGMADLKARLKRSGAL